MEKDINKFTNKIHTCIFPIELEPRNPINKSTCHCHRKVQTKIYQSAIENDYNNTTRLTAHGNKIEKYVLSFIKSISDSPV